jgi:hypothetical protein
VLRRKEIACEAISGGGHHRVVQLRSSLDIQGESHWIARQSAGCPGMEKRSWSQANEVGVTHAAPNNSGSRISDKIVLWSGLIHTPG